MKSVTSVLQCNGGIACRAYLVQPAGPGRASIAKARMNWSSDEAMHELRQLKPSVICPNIPTFSDYRRGGPGRATPRKLRQSGGLLQNLVMERDGGMGNGLGRRSMFDLRQLVLG